MPNETTYSNNYEDYIFDEKLKVGGFTKEITISANDVEIVITNSFEGGSNYWLGLDTSNEHSVWKRKPKGLPYSTWATQMLIEGETLHFYDIEDEDNTFTLNLEGLINGIKLNSENRPFDSDIENGDGSTSDCIIQYALFGKIEYC